MFKSTSISKVLIVLALTLAATAAFAVGPQWMPGFPMRMGPSVMLMWTPVPGATGYNIYKSDKDGALGSVLTSGPANNHMDMAAPMDKSAFYTVKALVGGAEGDPSPVGKIIAIKPLDPPKFTGNMYQNDALNLRWDIVQGAAFYNVFKAEAKEGPFNLMGSVQEAKYVDASAQGGKTYYYQVSAVDKNSVESPKSEPYEVKIEKVVVKRKAKTYDLIFKNATMAGEASPGEGLSYGGPGYMFYDPAFGKIVCIADSGILFLELDGKIAVRITKPADYQGDWGTPISAAIDTANNQIWTTWMSAANSVKVFSYTGELKGEANLDVPEEDYTKEGRAADMKEDLERGMKPMPLGIAVDAQGDVWVADGVFGQICIYNSNFDRIARLGSPRSRDAQNISTIKQVNTLLYDKKSNKIFGIDLIERIIRVFDAAKNDFVRDASGEIFYGWEKGGSGNGYVGLPKGAALDANGNIVLVDGTAASVQMLNTSSPDLDYVGSFGNDKKTNRLAEVEAPFGVLVAGDKLYVSEKLGNRIIIYNTK